eukprot:12424087-Karenia_brevis.AAC.1
MPQWEQKSCGKPKQSGRWRKGAASRKSLSTVWDVQPSTGAAQLDVDPPTTNSKDQLLENLHSKELAISRQLMAVKDLTDSFSEELKVTLGEQLKLTRMEITKLKPPE